MSLSSICLTLVLLSILIATIPTLLYNKRLFYYCKTIFTLQFVAGLAGVTDIVKQTMYGYFVVGNLHAAIFICIFVSCIASYLLKSHIMCCNTNLDITRKYE